VKENGVAVEFYCVGCQTNMRKPLILLLALVFCVGFAQVAMADNIQTLAEYNGTGDYPDPGPYQPSTVVGTFDIFSGDTSITISGTFGNSTVPNSAAVDLYLGPVLVAECIEFATCWSSGTPTPWTYTLTSADMAALGTGVVDFTADQTAEYTIRLGQTTLDQVPEPSSMALLVFGLLGLTGVRRKFAR